METASVVFGSALTGLPILLLHLGVAIGLWLTSTAIYFYATPLKKIALIQQGNIAAAIAASSVAISLGLPLAFCLAGSINVWDIVIWSAPILFIQICIFFVMNLLISNLPDKIEHGNIAAAIFVGAVRLTTAILLSASIMD